MPDTPPSATPPGKLSKAVALDYDAAHDAAPNIVATGRGAVAEQIVQIALDRGVKVREDADLIEILAAIDVDSPIPLPAFAAVAEILAYVYRAERRTPAGEKLR